MSLDQGKMMIAYDRKRTSTLTLDERPGAHTETVRQYIPGYSDSNIVYLDTVSGNDSNDGSTELLAKLTYASAATAAGTTKKIRVINDGAAFSTNINKPTEMKRGVSGTISSSLTAPINTWTQAATPSFSGTSINSLCFSDDLKKFVAVGDSGKIAYSTDGNAWTQAATPSFGSDNIRSVIYVKKFGVFVACGGASKIATSPDGNVWTIVTSSEYGTLDLYGLTYDPNGGSLYCFARGYYFTSVDGSIWQRGATDLGSAEFYDHCIFNGKIYLCGYDNTRQTNTEGLIYTLENGVFRQVSSTSFDQSPIRSIDASKTRLVAVGSAGKIAYSTDGNTWTQAATPSFSTSSLFSVRWFGEIGYFVASGAGGKIAYSTDGNTWTQAATPSFGSDDVQSLCVVSYLGRVVSAGVAGKIARSTAFANTISADIAGFTVQAVQYSGTVKAYNCTMKQPGTTANLSLNGCRVTEPDAHISSNTQKHTATLFEHDFHMTCTPAAQNDIQVNKCTFGESLYIYNASATAYEQVRDNIIEGGIKADFNVTVSGRDNIRGTSTNLLRGASVTSGDPKFASETDYTLQFQTNGYPRNSLAAGRSAIYFNSAGDARDIGAWSYVESAISYYYAKNSYINKGQDITVTIEETVSEQQGDNGPVSVYTNVNRIKEVLTIQYGSTDDTDRAIFDYIRTLTDKGVKIQLDPEFSSNGSTVTVNGNQSAGVEFLTVDSVATFNGMFLTISDKRYWVMRASPSASAATKLILDRPLEDAVTDNQVITTNYPSGAGEYQFSPPPQLALKRKDNSGLLTWKEGLVLRFVREWSA
jgi:photosystem II stability/assembly factor-like uncharacterized protein